MVMKKDKWIIITFALQKQELSQLHSNQMDMEKTQLPVRESVYWINMNVNTEHTLKQCTTCLEYQWTETQEKALHHEIPCRPWKVVDGGVFMINGKTLLCIVDYQSKFPVVKKVNSLSADDPLQMTKLIFGENGLPKNTVPDVATNLTADILKAFCRRMNIQQTLTSSYHHQSSG